MVRAYHCLNTARAVDGRGALETAALFREDQIKIEISKDINWGVEIPKITAIEGLGGEFREKHSHGNSLRIFETRDRFEKILQLLFELAPLEASLKRLGKEIQKTSRRINALEVMLMPRLQSEIRFIRGTLEEREREDSFRLRRIKNKKEQ
jgi:V/A-type H+-transporting ATPase subunit D